MIFLNVCERVFDGVEINGVAAFPVAKGLGTLVDVGFVGWDGCAYGEHTDNNQIITSVLEKHTQKKKKRYMQ
jgi:hypothetical protein